MTIQNPTSLDNLYEYIDGKNVEAKYTLKEIYAPEGYVTNPTPIVFKATRDGNNAQSNICRKLEERLILG